MSLKKYKKFFKMSRKSFSHRGTGITGTFHFIICERSET